MPEEKTKKENKDKGYIHAVGRRREAVARVRLYSTVKTGVVWGDAIIKKGEIYVNGMPIDAYFSQKTQQFIYQEPFKVTNTLHKYTFTIKVAGGGREGQVDAVVLGIARALQKLNRDEYRAILKKRGFLSRDARIRERRTVGTGGKARRQKQSPKR